MSGDCRTSPADTADDQLALHLLAAVVLREVAVERKASRLVGAELENNRLTRAGALGDAVRDIDREAVGDVLGGELDLDEVVLLDLDAGGRERELVAGDGDFANLAASRGTPRPQRAGARDNRHGEDCPDRTLAAFES